MGDEIARAEFTDADYHRFRRALREETKHLLSCFDADVFECGGNVCGFELEGWFVDERCHPAARGDELIQALHDPLVVPELSKFNFEINGSPRAARGNVLEVMHRELCETWKSCADMAETLGGGVLAIGIPPTADEKLLTIDSMSPLKRYHALNEAIFALRKGNPLAIDIRGRENLKTKHRDIMIEALTTSLQVHFQVNPALVTRVYNASIVLSAATVAAAANSPYLFGRQLWDETRIPLFEQSVRVPSFRDMHGDHVGRVTFGTGYAKHSLLEPFLENLDGYQVVLPLHMNEDPARFEHLRLHNGTIWRWNRPLIGPTKRGQPHLRVEHRVCGAGPSMRDVIANIAFYLGAAYSLALRNIPPESQMSFEVAKDNFYRAARDGLDADVLWLGGKRRGLRDVILEELAPAALEGLVLSGVAESDAVYYINEILVERVRSGQNGASWQKQFIARHGRRFSLMTQRYCAHQKRDVPVHEWSLDR